jgi:hypothetical protein
MIDVMDGAVRSPLVGAGSGECGRPDATTSIVTLNRNLGGITGKAANRKVRQRVIKITETVG